MSYLISLHYYIGCPLCNRLLGCVCILGPLGCVCVLDHSGATVGLRAYPCSGVDRGSLVHQDVPDAHVSLLGHEVERGQSTLEKRGRGGATSAKERAEAQGSGDGRLLQMLSDSVLLESSDSPSPRRSSLIIIII